MLLHVLPETLHILCARTRITDDDSQHNKQHYSIRTLSLPVCCNMLNLPNYIFTTTNFSISWYYSTTSWLLFVVNNTI